MRRIESRHMPNDEILCYGTPRVPEVVCSLHRGYRLFHEDIAFSISSLLSKKQGKASHCKTMKLMHTRH